jgi:hypothetical protein
MARTDARLSTCLVTVTRIVLRASNYTVYLSGLVRSFWALPTELPLANKDVLVTFSGSCRTQFPFPNTQGIHEFRVTNTSFSILFGGKVEVLLLRLLVSASCKIFGQVFRFAFTSSFSHCTARSFHLRTIGFVPCAQRCSIPKWDREIDRWHQPRRCVDVTGHWTVLNIHKGGAKDV